GSAADSDFHIETISVDSLDDCLHVNHCCCQQCAHADDLGIVIRRGTNEFIRTSVCAKIHYRETRSLGHHTDEILADIMQITLHSPHNDGALAAGVFAFRQQWAQYFHSGFHCSRREKYFWNKDAVVFEILADDAHSGDQAILEDFIDRPAGG